MKNSIGKICAALAMVLAAAPALTAESLKTMNLGGATGLYTIPSGQVSWQEKSLGLNAGSQFTGCDRYGKFKAAHNIGVNLGFLKWLEAGAAIDFQPDYWTADSGNNNDLLLGAKIQLPLKNTSYPAVAIGGNIQFLNMGGENVSYQNEYGSTGQVYAAITYTAAFFGAPVETTAVLGKTFVMDTTARIGKSNSNIDFGMGLDVTLFPKVLQDYVHWTAEYANFSYSHDPLGTDPWWRGEMTTGIRLDLSQIPALNKFTFTLDIMGTDVLDHKERGFSLGLVFGVPVL
ncbi:MAG: hypothetical protein LBP32_06240 [Spirochaetaceae bacterium]|nr:hypothetical protein [Spirochaetaceae bacterium]